MNAVSNAGSQQPAQSVMLKKTLDFQQENATKLLAGAAQDNGAASGLRTGALHAQGKGQQLNVTV